MYDPFTSKWHRSFQFRGIEFIPQIDSRRRTFHVRRPPPFRCRCRCRCRRCVVIVCVSGLFVSINLSWECSQRRERLARRETLKYIFVDFTETQGNAFIRADSYKNSQILGFIRTRYRLVYAIMIYMSQCCERTRLFFLHLSTRQKIYVHTYDVNVKCFIITARRVHKNSQFCIHGRTRLKWLCV